MAEKTPPKKTPAKKKAPAKKAPSKQKGAKHTSSAQVKKAQSELKPDTKTLAEMINLGGGADVFIGRKTAYTVEIGAEICARLACGESLNSICDDAHLPHRATVLRWVMFADDESVHANPELRNMLIPFREHYQYARIAQAEGFIDELTDIADDSRNDYMDRQVSQGRTARVIDPEAVNRSKLRKETRTWLAEIYLPKVQALRDSNVRLKGQGGSVVLQFDSDDENA